MAMAGAMTGYLTGPGAVVISPIAAVAGKNAGETASQALDPYPGVRDAWLDALPHYQLPFERGADELRKSSKTNRPCPASSRRAHPKVQKSSIKPSFRCPETRIRPLTWFEPLLKKPAIT
jgi:hypothetical protein